MTDPSRIAEYSRELLAAEAERAPIAPITGRDPAFTVEDAYAVQSHATAERCALGARLVGRKIGLTSKPIQTALGVREPDYGQLLDTMHVYGSGTVELARLIQPKAEGEIAFVLERDLDKEFITEADVLHAVGFVVPAIEIIDSRIRDWTIRIQDTVADNASSGLFVLGSVKTPLDGLDLRLEGMVLSHNDAVAATGAGAAALGSPVRCVAWLANTLRAHGIIMRAGEIVLSGALSATVTPAHGDRVRVSFQHLGSVSVHFA